MRESPYAGLMPFTEEQAPFFFGRDREREIITANLLAARLTLFYGPSGVGKSSVLNAGVAYHLRQAARHARRSTPEFAIVLFRNWRDDPIASLERAIALEVGVPAAGATFADRLCAWASAINGALLIVLDQFEEYFLYHANETGAGTFAHEFPRALHRPDVRANFLVSMREDSIAKLDSFKGVIPNLFDNYLRIDHLDRAEAREAILRPVDHFNELMTAPAERVDVEPALVDLVLDQVTPERLGSADAGRGRIARAASDASGRIQTPYLQLVMTRLWQEEANQRSPVIRADTLARLGGADRIVATHLDSALATLSEQQREAAARIFQYLVTPSRTKIALGVEDLADYAKMSPAELQPLLLQLSSGESRILSPVAPAPDQPALERFQIFHDVLASAVLDWRNKYVKQAEQKASAAEAEEQRRRAEKEARAAKRLRQLLALALALFVVAAATAWVAWQQTKAATIAELRASQSAAEAEVGNRTVQEVRLRALEAEKLASASREGAQVELLAVRAENYQLQGRRDDELKARAAGLSAQNRQTADRLEAKRLGLEAAKEKAAGDAALAEAERFRQARAKIEATQVLKPTPAPELPEAKPATSGTTVVPDKGSARPSNPVAGPETPTGGSVPPDKGATMPAGGSAITPNVPTIAPQTGDYRETYRSAIDAKNRRQWDRAATLFRAALALRGIDTGERISISGFGNIEPYVPQYYLGLSLKNLGDCAGALRAWDLSEKDGAIHKTGLYKALQQGRLECQSRQ